jgi:hypothetical protein
MLLAIYPVATLAARAARVRATHRRGAELVFAALESNRYVYDWDLGPTSELVTPDSAMAILKAAPDLIFPFGVSGATCIERHGILELDDVRWPRDNGNPVLVSQADSTSFTVVTLPGHFRGPGRTIEFTILSRDGRLILRHVGATSGAISDIAYDGGAWFSWRAQAATLRAALSDHRNGLDRGRPASEQPGLRDEEAFKLRGIGAARPPRVGTDWT